MPPGQTETELGVRLVGVNSGERVKVGSGWLPNSLVGGKISRKAWPSDSEIR